MYAGLEIHNVESPLTILCLPLYSIPSPRVRMRECKKKRDGKSDSKVTLIYEN